MDNHIEVDGDRAREHRIRDDDKGRENNVKDDDKEDEDLVSEVCSHYILHWNYRHYKKLPRELLHHGTNIQELYLKENGLECLPDNLNTSLPHLTNIYLYKNFLTSLPPDIGSLTNLIVLDLSRNHLTYLPDSITSLNTLTILDLSHNHLGHLPHSLGDLSHLEYLVAPGNKLTLLPQSASSLKRLVGLYLGSNQLAWLPSLANCLKLQEIYLDNNRLTHLPGQLTVLPRLTILSISGNNLEYLPAIPALACPRLICEDNPHLCHIPYIVGCQQTLLAYSTQASWQQSSPWLDNVTRGVWSFRSENSGKCPGCPQCSGTSNCLHIQVEFRILSLPHQLIQVYSSFQSQVSSLLELCLKAVYNLTRSGFRMTTSVTRDIHLHIYTLTSNDSHPDAPVLLDRPNLEEFLPTCLIEILSSGPTAYCNYPDCGKPIFRECCIQVVPREVQKQNIGSLLELEVYPQLTTIYYCNASCCKKYASNCSNPWEEQLLDLALPWTLLQ